MNKKLLLMLVLATIVAVLFVSSTLLQSEFYHIVDVFNVLVLKNGPLAIFVFILNLPFELGTGLWFLVKGIRDGLETK